jgi:ParB family transcriptional regulator, chromosome partitioning protein
MANKSKLSKEKKGFDMDSATDNLMAEVSERVTGIETKSNYDLREIPLGQIRYNSKNNFGMRDIEKLAESIQEHGQQHNAVVRVLHDDSNYQYEMVSGERRHRALTILEKETIFCKVIDVDELEAEALTIILNLETRVPNDIELSGNATRLAEIVKLKKKDGEYKGERTNEVVAKMLTTESNKVDTAKVTKLLTIQNLIPQFKTQMDNGELSLEKANQFAQMPQEQQILVFEMLEEGKTLSAKQVKELKEKLILEKDEEVKKIIAEQKIEINNLEEQTKDFKEQAEKALIKIKTIDEEKKILANDLKKTQNNLEKLQTNQNKAKEEQDKIIDDIKAQLKDEAKKDIEEQNKEEIQKLQSDLKIAQEQSEKIENKFKTEMDKLKAEHKTKEEVLQAKLKEKENIEYNKAIQSLGRQAQKALSVLLEEINKYITITGFELTEETKSIIADVSKFDGKL